MKSPILELGKLRRLTHILSCSMQCIQAPFQRVFAQFFFNYRKRQVNNGGKWLITKGACREQVWNGRHGAATTKLICYASPVLRLYTWSALVWLFHHPYLYSFWFIAGVSATARETNSIMEPDSYQAISWNQVSSYLFHWAGPGLYNFDDDMQSSITVIFNWNQVPSSDQHSVPLGWTWFEK